MNIDIATSGKVYIAPVGSVDTSEFRELGYLTEPISFETSLTGEGYIIDTTMPRSMTFPLHEIDREALDIALWGEEHEHIRALVDAGFTVTDEILHDGRRIRTIVKETSK